MRWEFLVIKWVQRNNIQKQFACHIMRGVHSARCVNVTNIRPLQGRTWWMMLLL